MHQQVTRILLIAALVHLFALPVLAQLGGDDPQLSDTRPVLELDQYYERYFIVRYDPELLPLTGALLQASVSDALIDRSLASIERDDLRGQVDFSLIPSSIDRSGAMEGGGGGMRGIGARNIRFAEQELAGDHASALCMFGFRCTKDVDAKTRSKIWQAVVTELAKSWKVAHQNAREERDEQRTEAYDRSRRKLAEAEDKLEQVTAVYVELQIATGTSSNQLRNILQNSIDDQRRINMELRGEEALRGSLEKRAAELVQSRESDGAQEAVTEQLMQVLKLREETLARVVQLYKSGQVSEAEVAKTREAVAVAKVEYLKARKEAAEAAGGKDLKALNAELSQLATRVVKNKAIVAATDEQIDELRNQLAVQLRAEMDMQRTKQRMELLQSTVQLLSKKCAELDVQDEHVQRFSVTPWGE